MLTFYLVRHGQKEDVFGDPALTAVGKKQAEVTATYFRNKGIHTIYSSPAKRTLETAKIISRQIKLDIRTDNRLRERMNWGDRQGETFTEFMKEWIKTDRDRLYKPLHGRSSSEAGNHLSLVLNEISTQYKYGSILVVTHGGIIGDFLRNTFSAKILPLREYKETSAKYLEIPECSLTIVEKHDKKYILEKVGSISHLPVPIS